MLNTLDQNVSVTKIVVQVSIGDGEWIHFFKGGKCHVCTGARYTCWEGEGWGGTWGLACEGFCEGEVLREVLHGKKYLKMENRGFSSPSHTLWNCHIPKQEHSLRNLILPLTIHLSTCTV